MKKLKSEKGAITLIALVSVMFLVSFLISSYVMVANKVQMQKQIIKETQKIYEPKSSIEEIYSSYFSTNEVIPIYTAEQLLAIGEENKIININGKYYTFTNKDTYILKNNLTIYEEQLPENWTAPEIFFMKSQNTGTIGYNGYTVTIKYENETEKVLDGNPIITLDISDGAIEIANTGYKIVSTDGTILDSEEEYTGPYIITGNTIANDVKISGRGDFEITLKDLSIDLSSMQNQCAFNANYDQIQKGKNVTIKLEGDNALKGGNGSAGLGFVGAIANIDGETEGSTLTIEGNGRLNVTGGGNYSAGIGGAYTGINSPYGDVNNIIINSGTIIATAGSNGCGIGSGWGKSANNIVINGGNIIADSGNRHGIGSINNDNNYIIINGGNITTYGREYGEGLHAANIIINGGRINAISTNRNRVGIYGEGLVINGGTIITTATKDNVNPGIGIAIYKGQSPTEEQIASINVKINGGNVISTGSYPIGARNSRSICKEFTK